MPIHRQTGNYAQSTTAGETVRAFVPLPLPPTPPLELGEFLPLLDSSFEIGVGRKHGAKWRFPQENATFYCSPHIGEVEF
jgi:hypothetical protein